MRYPPNNRSYLFRQFEDPDVLPSEIVEIVGKSYGFGISGDETNLDDGNGVYEAFKIWSLDDILWKRVKSIHQQSISTKKQCSNFTEINKVTQDEAIEKNSG